MGGEDKRRGAFRTVDTSCSRTEDGKVDLCGAFLFALKTNRTRPTELNVFFTVNKFFFVRRRASLLFFILSAEC